MRRPLLLPLLCFAGGIQLEGWLGWDVVHLWVLVGISFVGAVLWSRERARLLPVVVFCVGGLHAALEMIPYSAADLRLVAGAVPMLVTVHGRLAGEPELKRGTEDHAADPLWRVMLDCDELESGDGKRAARGSVLVFSKGDLRRRLHVGMRVTVFGVLQPPAAAAAVGLFDHREKLRREGVHHQLMTESTNDWRLVGQTGNAPLSARFRDWAIARLRAGQASDEASRLLSAMILGLRTGLTEEVAEPFMRSGTMHIFAISGLHVALVAGMLIGLLQVGRVPRSWCGLVVIPALWCYCCVTGWQPSATRATIMTTVIVLGWTLRRPVDLLNSVSAAAFLILLWNPLQLQQVSFQLSFAVVVTITLLWPRMDEWGERLFARDPLLPADLESWGNRQLRRVGRAAYSLVAISLAAWLGSMPLIAFYFHLWTPGSLVANPPVVLLTTVAIASALGGLLGALIWPPVGEVYAQGAWFWVVCQTCISEWVSALPGGWRYMVAPTVVEVVTYYGVLFAWCGRWFTRRRTGLVLAVVVALIGLRVARQGGAEITVLSQSTNSVFCDLPGSAGDLLIDCGRSHGVARVVIPFVHSRGLSSVPRLLLTHGDAGHVEGFKLVMTELRPGQVSISGVEQRSVAYRAAVAAVAVPDIVSRGDRIGPWQVLHPAYPQGGVATADDVAVTLRGEIEGIRVMIMPDASRVAQLAMLERWADLGAEVLIVGCPREGEEILEDFLLRVAPETIVLQDNWTPAYDRANGALLRRLHCFANNVRAVSRHGSVTIRLQDGAYSMVSISGLSK